MKRIIIPLLVIMLFLSGCKSSERGDGTPTQPTPEITESAEETKKTEETKESDEMPVTDTYKPLNFKNMKAMWLSQFDLEAIYTSKKTQADKIVFEKRIEKALDLVKENGFNTVILQVRPYADSFYPSEYYPPSKYVTGNYENNFNYDPIPIIIDRAHTIGLSVHAWINPLRGMTEDEVKAVDNTFAVKKWYLSRTKDSAYVTVYNDRLYLDPAYEETRSLITDGIKEIITSYNFDGVHMDDYFYPTTSESFDSISYQSYVKNGGKETLRQFRYNNINKLVAGIYSAVKTENKDMIFGISPAGNIDNVTEKAFADVYTWMSEDGYIDYICPQIYFGMEHGSLPFDKTLAHWSSLIKNKNVSLIAGMTLGKALSKTDQWAGSGKNEWSEHSDILKRCLESTVNIDKIQGVSIFCFQYYYDPVTFTEVDGTKAERENLTPLLKDISWN